MRLIHYSAQPLTEVVSRPHGEPWASIYKTPGLWVSVEGEYDWPWWCIGERFGLERLAHATEVILKPDARILHLTTDAEIDTFTEKYGVPPPWRKTLEEFGTLNPEDEAVRYKFIDWPEVRWQYQGLIIAPYCWGRRLEPKTMWYYGWDCASGVIWDAEAVAELRPTDAPDLTKLEEAAA